jgi:uncharacterized membrane protein
MVAFILLGLLLAGLGVPLSMGKVPPNHIYGFRTRHTLSDPNIWYPANAYSGNLMTIAGLILAIVAPLLVILPGIDEFTYPIALLITILVVMGVVMTLSLNYIKHL